MIQLALLQDFITEATDHLEEMETNLLALEQNPDNLEVLNDIFRSIHTIKGASMFVGLTRISELSHKLENLLDLLRQGQKPLTPEIADTLIDCSDRLTALTRELEKDQEEHSEIDDLLARILKLSASTADEEEVVVEPPPAPPAEAAPDDAILADGFDDSILGEDLDDSILDETLADSFIEEPREAEAAADSLSEALSAALNQNPAPIGNHESARTVAHPDPEEEPVTDEAIRNELAGEVYDEELSKIFTNQFHANLARLAELPDGPFDDSTRDAWTACLGNMRSSANYMGYRRLTALLDTIRAKLDTAGEPDLAYLRDVRRRLNGILADGSRPAVAVAEDNPFAIPGASDERESSQSQDDALIREQIAEEIYDAELYKIFIQQLETNYRGLKNLTARPADRQKQELLATCEEILNNLKSSANYMGYGYLVDFYRNWQMAVQDAFARAGREPVEIRFMEEWLTRLRRIFPDLPAEVAPETGAEEQAASAEATPDLQVKTTGKKKKASPAKVEEEADLFKTLSGSVDAALSDQRDSELEPLHGILEEMLFAETPPPAAAKPAPPPPAAPPPAQPASLETAGAEECEEELEERREEERRQQEDRREFDRRLGDRRKMADKGERILKHSVRVDSQKIDSLMNQVGELVVSRAYFTQIFNDLRNLHQELKEQAGYDSRGLKPIREVAFKLGEATLALSRVSNELQEGVMKIRMLPVSQLFNRYPRLVRDLVKKTAKKVEIVIRGEDTELDKMVIEEISDPMIHIIRNAIDHGIETTRQRQAAGKPEVAALTLEAYHESNHIVIEVTDDGRGIDLEKVKAKAVERGLLQASELGRISDSDARRFIMMPGFSTADKTTETSGRGVGMDVIKTNIEKLNGTVEVESEFGAFTRIRIKIPLTLAIIQALMIRVGREIYTIPLSVVEETLRIHEHETSIIEGVEVIHLRDITMPIFRLADIFRIPGTNQDISQSFVVIVTTGMQRIGIVVDELIGQEEVVIKPLVDYLREDSGFSGATIIGDGRISLILDIYELVKMTSARQVDRYREQSRKRKNKSRHKTGKQTAKKIPAAKQAATQPAAN